MKDMLRACQVKLIHLMRPSPFGAKKAGDEYE